MIVSFNAHNDKVLSIFKRQAIKHAFTTFILLFVMTGVQATAQSADDILIDGESYALYTNPLKPYLKEIMWEPPEEAVIGSSNWRGYLAKWEIKADKLILVDMSIRKWHDSLEQKMERKSIMGTVFPDKEQIVAVWYSGALIIPYGERINYVHLGYGSTYEKYTIINIKNGSVTEHFKMSHSEFISYRDRKFKAFIKTEKFKNNFKELVGGEYEWSKEEAMDFMQSFYAEYYLSL